MINQAKLENAIYAAIISECERAETAGTYRGNGHHLAQRITTKAVKLIQDDLAKATA